MWKIKHSSELALCMASYNKVITSWICFLVWTLIRIWDKFSVCFLLGLRPFSQAQSFVQTPRTPTLLECLSYFKWIWRGGSHTLLWICLQREPQGSGEIHSFTSGTMCTWKNCEKRWRTMNFSLYQVVYWEESHQWSEMEEIHVTYECHGTPSCSAYMKSHMYSLCFILWSACVSDTETQPHCAQSLLLNSMVDTNYSVQSSSICVCNWNAASSTISVIDILKRAPPGGQNWIKVWIYTTFNVKLLLLLENAYNSILRHFNWKFEPSPRPPTHSDPMINMHTDLEQLKKTT